MAPGVKQIFNSYRAIKPKPILGESAGSAPSDPPSSSLSYERTSGAKTVSSDGSRGKRSRKRIGTEPRPPPARRAKRGSTTKLRTVCWNGPAVIGGVQKSAEQFAPDRAGLQSMLPCPTGGVFRPMKGGALTPFLCEMADGALFNMADGQGGVPPRRRNVGFGALKFEIDTKLTSSKGSERSPRAGSLQDACAPLINDGHVLEEPAFMDRAAAASSPQPPIERESSSGFQKLRGGYDGGFDASLKRGPDGQPYSAPSIRSLDFHFSSPSTNKTPESHKRASDHVWDPDHRWVSYSNGGSEGFSDIRKHRQTSPVTLSLLRDSPSHNHTSHHHTVSEATKLTNSDHLSLSLTMGCISGNSEIETETQGESPDEMYMSSTSGRDFGQETGGRSSPSERESHDSHALELLDKESNSVDVNAFFHMEENYSASSDPMMLTDQGSGDILWENQAHKKADVERTHGKTKGSGAPYLDPLGIRTQLGLIDYQPLQGPRTKAILWGFLKKFIGPGLETNRVNSVPRAPGRGDGEDRNPQEGRVSSIQNQEFPQILPASHPKPITPQPVRPVGSTLTLLNLLNEEGINRFPTPVTDDLEVVKGQLESIANPCVITDYRNRVRWVNTAYKQMVGQPECPWLASTVEKKTAKETSQHNKEISQQNRLTGEVMLICHKQLSQLSAHFQCSVHVQWTNNGGEHSITVHSEVARMENEKLGHMFIWKLHTDTLSKNSRAQN